MSFIIPAPVAPTPGDGLWGITRYVEVNVATSIGVLNVFGNIATPVVEFPAGFIDSATPTIITIPVMPDGNSHQYMITASLSATFTAPVADPIRVDLILDDGSNRYNRYSTFDTSGDLSFNLGFFLSLSMGPGTQLFFDVEGPGGLPIDVDFYSFQYAIIVSDMA